MNERPWYLRLWDWLRGIERCWSPSCQKPVHPLSDVDCEDHIPRCGTLKEDGTPCQEILSWAPRCPDHIDRIGPPPAIHYDIMGAPPLAYRGTVADTPSDFGSGGGGSSSSQVSCLEEAL